ncbi:glycosyl transferase family 2 [Longibacter salinarum]|uniref:Glycosyl transferase family 2 n=1 Tax=Longibacter salinarum TaxID=1850348 RepID=A0A2A8D278_9BACT|nr:glycosyltransferase [Longibacter salinarum]PEN14991.1 glycosyl transferase family 2 [Longibacter salinarum]
MPTLPYADFIAPYLAGVHVLIWVTLLANIIYLRRKRTRKQPDIEPFVSILIPARNEEENLRRLLPSLLEQDYEHFEVIVVDDGSTDATWNVLSAANDNRLRPVRGEGPPPGWLGKPHACYVAASHAEGDRYLFLDADTELADSGALRRIVERESALPDDTVATGLPRLRGAAQILVSLVPNAILTGLPWPLVRPLRIDSLGALNGQCWMIDADRYHAYEPHVEVKNKVLEDVEIGRYFKREGFTPALLDVRDEITVYMYSTFGDAWRGFRKNAYLILGGSPASFVGLYLFFFLTFVASPFVHPGFLASVLLLKGTTDRLTRFSPLFALLAPVSYLLGSALQLDSAISHWTGRVSWKGRSVGAVAVDRSTASNS